MRAVVLMEHGGVSGLATTSPRASASVVGSILGNILLVMGVSMLAGGLRRDRQFFEARAASAQSLMLFLAAVALIMPAISQLVSGGGLPEPTARAVEFLPT